MWCRGGALFCVNVSTGLKNCLSHSDSTVLVSNIKTPHIFWYCEVRCWKAATLVCREVDVFRKPITVRNSVYIECTEVGHILPILVCLWKLYLNLKIFHRDAESVFTLTFLVLFCFVIVLYLWFIYSHIFAFFVIVACAAKPGLNSQYVLENISSCKHLLIPCLILIMLLFYTLIYWYHFLCILICGFYLMCFSLCLYALTVSGLTAVMPAL